MFCFEAFLVGVTLSGDRIRTYEPHELNRATYEQAVTVWMLHTPQSIRCSDNDNKKNLFDETSDETENFCGGAPILAIWNSFLMHQDCGLQRGVPRDFFVFHFGSDR